VLHKDGELELLPHWAVSIKGRTRTVGGMSDWSKKFKLNIPAPGESICLERQK